MSAYPVKSLTTDGGLRVVAESSSLLPLVDFVICLRGGASFDPDGSAGATRLMARLLRCGTSRYSRRELEDAIASLGGRYSVTVGRDLMRVGGTVLARNLGPFIEILAHMLKEAKQDPEDFDKEKRRLLVQLSDERDLLERHARDHYYGAHLYGRSVGGSKTSVEGISLPQISGFLDKMLCRENLLFAASGDVELPRLCDLIDEAFAGLPKGRRRRPRTKKPKLASRRSLRVVHKEHCNQTELAITTGGVDRDHARLAAAVVGSTAFGGLFSSRLTHEVRAVRGWSYSAHASLRALDKSGSFGLWTHPPVEKVRACAELELELLDNFCAFGPTQGEVKQAKRYLRGSRCLDVDTPVKRVELSLDAVINDQPVNWPGGYGGRIGRVKRDEVHQVFAELDRRRLCLCAVGDAKLLVPALEGLVDEVEVIDATTPAV